MGMTPVNEVRAWWDSLSREGRRSVALHMLGALDSFNPWDEEWDHLGASRQQANLRFHYDGALLSSCGTPPTPMHGFAHASEASSNRTDQSTFHAMEMNP
jgi:hypothetical protein